MLEWIEKRKSARNYPNRNLWGNSVNHLPSVVKLPKYVSNGKQLFVYPVGIQNLARTSICVRNSGRQKSIEFDDLSGLFFVPLSEYEFV